MLGKQVLPLPISQNLRGILSKRRIFACLVLNSVQSTAAWPIADKQLIEITVVCWILTIFYLGSFEDCTFPRLLNGLKLVAAPCRLWWTLVLALLLFLVSLFNFFLFHVHWCFDCMFKGVGPSRTTMLYTIWMLGNPCSNCNQCS